MKKGLLGSTAIVGAVALAGGAAQAAEAPTWKLSGNANFQFYYVDNDSPETFGTWTTTASGSTSTIGIDYNDIYFGVDESEIAINASGTADNGLKYGLKIEINVNTDDIDEGGDIADEVRLSLGGSWGTLHLGDEDGAEDIMNYGGESIMGATGGFDGDWGDVGGSMVGGAPSGPTIEGDTGDATKISYYSPRFSGLQVGVSLTPNPGAAGDANLDDSSKMRNNIGLGVNYDNSFGGVRVRASGVFASASNEGLGADDSAWSIGTVVGFGPASVGFAYGDNGDSGTQADETYETSYWDVAASFETGPLYLSAGYFVGTLEDTGGDDEFTNLSLTVDYSVAPGLATYAEYNMNESENAGGTTMESNVLIAGVKVSF